MPLTTALWTRAILLGAIMGIAGCSGGGGGGSTPAAPGSAPATNAPIAAPIVTPIPTSAPTTMPTSVPTVAPSSTAPPVSPAAVAFLPAGSAPNSYQGSIAAGSKFAVVDAISTSQITTTSGASPNLASGAISLALGTSATTYARGRMATLSSQADLVAMGTLLRGELAIVPAHPTLRGEPDETGLDREIVALASQRVGTSRASVSSRQRAAIGTTIGSTNSFYVSTAAIGQKSTTTIQQLATLRATSAHGYIWIDNTLSLAQASIDQIATDYENAYTSDVTHFGTPEYTSSSPGASATTTPCDSTGTRIAGAAPVPVFIAPPAGKHVVFVVNTQTLGSGVGGYYAGVNHFPQAIANCFIGQPKSNEVSMIYVSYDPTLSDAFNVRENLVRGTSHEFQHLISFVNHAILSTSSAPKLEDTWLNEGLSMIAQDFAVASLFPQQAVDVDDALYRAQLFLAAPQNYRLTGFTGMDPNATSFSYNCAGCYGASYLFTRYLYEQYGGDTFSRAMESSGTVSYAGLQAQTGQDPVALVKNFSVALTRAKQSSPATPYAFTTFDPFGTYVDQFGSTLKLVGPSGYMSQPGKTTTYNPYVGTFYYVFVSPTSAQGSGVTITDQSGSFALSSALIQN